MDLRTFGRALRRSWWVIVLTTVLGTAIAALITAEIAPTYASRVTFLVSTPNAGSTNALQAQQVAQLQVNSYVELLTSDGLAERLVGSPGLEGLSETDIESRITPSTPTNTTLVTATVVDTSKKRAYALTDAIRVQFPKMVADLATAADSQTTLSRVSGPRLESAPVGPHKTLNIGLGLLVGLALGLMAAFLRLLLDTSVRTGEQVEDATGASVIGNIGFEKTARQQPVIVTGGVRSVRAEGFRQLRTNLLFANVDKPVQVLVVTSTVPGEGKSTVSTNLGIVFAESGERVLLIEADLRKPRLADYLGLERAVGLTNVLAGQVDLDDVLQTWGNTGLTVLTSGSLPPNPSEMLGSDHMRELMQTLRARFDVIVIDTPPLLPVTDAAVASSLADGAVLVVRHGKTSVSNLQQAAQALRSVDARILGAVLNMRKSQVTSRYGGYGYYEDAPVADIVPIAPTGSEPDTGSVEPEPLVEAEPVVEPEPVVEAEPAVDNVADDPAPPAVDESEPAVDRVELLAADDVEPVVVDEAEPPAADEAELPAADEAELPVVDEPEPPVADEPEPPVADEPEPPVADEAEPPVADEAEPPVADEAELPVVDGSESFAADEAELPVADEAEPVADEPELLADEVEPVADEPELLADEVEPVADEPAPLADEVEPPAVDELESADEVEAAEVGAEPDVAPEAPAVARHRVEDTVVQQAAVPDGGEVEPPTATPAKAPAAGRPAGGQPRSNNRRRKKPAQQRHNRANTRNGRSR